MALPVPTGRLGLRLTPNRDGRAALAIYRPLTLRGRMLRAAVAAASVLPGSLVDEPGVMDAAELAGIAAGGIAVMDSSSPGRIIVGYAAGRVLAVAKIGPAGDEHLRHEADMLRRGLSRSTPALLAAGELTDGRSAIVTSWVPGNPVRDLTVALSVAVDLAASNLTHGDLAPWNVLGDGPIVIDWESAAPGLMPLHDLTHYVLRSAAHLRAGDARWVFDQLCGSGGVGAAYADRTGISPFELPSLVAGYLDRTVDAAASAAERALRPRLRILLNTAMGQT